MLAQIVSIAYLNSWEGSNGPMHTSTVTFADGLTGTANHKNPSPPYRVGETVEYQITGNHRGTNKLKIGKPQAPGAAPQQYQQQPAFQPPPQNQPQTYQQAPQNAPAPTQWRPAGQSVGMAIVQACEFLRAQNKGWVQSEAHLIASSILRLGYMLENGQLAPKPAAPQPPPPPQPAPQYQPPPQQEHRAGHPAGPGGSVSLDPDDSDVPFAPERM